MDIKFGAHAFIWHERWSNQELYLIDNAKELGLSLFEISIGDEVEFDAGEIKKASESAGVEISISPGNIWPFECDISHENPDYRKNGMEWHKRWLDKGGEAGVVAYAGAMYAHPGRIERRRPSEEEWKYAAENLHILSEYASRRGITFVIEAMSHFRTHLVNTPEQMLRLKQMADHDNLKVLIDTYHLITEITDFAVGIELVKDHLWGMHPCENNRGVPDNGLVPWQSVCATLKKIDFSGYLVFESYNSSIRDGDFAYSRGMFHNVCPDGNEFVAKGMEFLKKELNDA